MNKHLSTERHELESRKEDMVCSKIGAALVSAQRVESITGQILSFLEEHGEVYRIMTEDFTSNSEKSKKSRIKTLGQIFSFLKLNPKLIIADELDEYARIRNISSQIFAVFLNTKSD